MNSYKIETLSVKSLIKNRLFNNMSWLFILHFTNKIIPFFTFPYITRIFLPEGFGILTFAQSFIFYFQVFIDYGFNLTGTRLVAAAEENKKELSRIYTAIISTKFLFFLLAVPIIITLTLLNSKLYLHHEIIFIFILLALSNVLMPIWMFQGLQRVRNMTIISLSIRIIFLISVFTLVKSPEDLPLYAILYSISFLFIGIISMVVIKFHIKVKFCKVSFNDIKGMVKDGLHVFMSSAVISVMTQTGIFVLGLFYSAEYSGYFSGISKINQVITMLFYPIGQAIFPFLSKKYSLSFKYGYISTIKIAKVIIPVFALMSILIVLFRKPIVLLILGPHFINIANALIVMGFLPLLSIISNLVGTQILVASGHTKEYGRAFLRNSLISISLYFILGYFYGIWGVVTAALFSEIFCLLLLYTELHRIVRREKGVKL